MNTSNRHHLGVLPLRVVYFTATFPHVVMLILLISCETLEGARDGIEFHIGSQSNLTKVLDVQLIVTVFNYQTTVIKLLFTGFCLS